MSNERTTIELLADLNMLRQAAGKAPLSSWKASRAELLTRIAELTPGQHLGATPAPAQPAPDMSAIADAIAAAPVTKVAATAPELTVPAKRNAAIKGMVEQSIATETPTSVIDIKIASRKLSKAEKKASSHDKLRKGEKLGKKPVAAQDIKTKSPKQVTAPKSELTTFLVTIDMDPKIARAKLRRAGFSAPYQITPELKAALTGDARKKSK